MQKHVTLRAPFVILALSTLVGVGLASCGQVSSKQTSSIPGVLPAKDLSDAQNLALQGQVTCPDPKQCNPSVAMLTYTTPSNVKVCTAFLIAPDIAVTNSHCIPDDLKSNGSDCSDRIWLFFPAIGDIPAMQVECSQVITASPKKEFATPDYAFLKVAQAIDRPVLPVSDAGLPDQMNVHVTRVNPTSDTLPNGVMDTTPCRVIQGSILLPEFDKDQSTLATFTDCTLVHGNAGSPVIADDGTVRALVQAVFNKKVIETLYVQQKIPLLDGDIAQIDLGTSFACVRTPLEDPSKPFPPACAESQEGTVDPFTRALIAQQADKSLENQIQVWGENAAVPFVWTAQMVSKNSPLLGPIQELTSSADNPKVYAIPVPSCIRDPKEWIDQYRNKWYQFWLPRYPSTAALDIALPVWEADAGVKYDLKAGFRIQQDLLFIQAHLDFNPQDIDKNQRKNGKSKIQLTVTDPLFPSERVLNTTLGICTAEALANSK